MTRLRSGKPAPGNKLLGRVEISRVNLLRPLAWATVREERASQIARARVWVPAEPIASEAGTFRGVALGTGTRLEGVRGDSTDRARAAIVIAASRAWDPVEQENSAVVAVLAVVAEASAAVVAASAVAAVASAAVAAALVVVAVAVVAEAAEVAVAAGERRG